MAHAGLQEAAFIALGEYTARVQAMTWGHLAPKPQRAYSGYILFINAAYGGAIEIVDADFEELSDSPWLYDDMMDFACKFLEQFYNTKAESAGLYLFEGHYRKYKNGNYRLCGSTRKIKPQSLFTKSISTI